jgi:Calpain family cysteine protease
MPPIAPILVSDPIAAYAEIAATLQPGQRYVMEFDYNTVENPDATAQEYAEVLYPQATVLGADSDIGSWEIHQASLGACGHFSQIAAYASSKTEYRLETGIYPTEISPISLYFLRIQDPSNPLSIKWIAIDSKMPIKPGGKTSNFIGLASSGAIAPMLALKAEAAAKGGSFNEITNHPSFNIGFNWFPSTTIATTSFEEFADAIARGGLYVYSLVQQYDGVNPITPLGVVYAHGYSAPDTLKVTNTDGTETKLVFMSNPWGGGSDFISPYGDTSTFWDEHPELADKVAASRQAGGEFWVSWDMFCQLVGKTTHDVRVPFPLSTHPFIKFIPRTFTDETAIASSTVTSNLAALAQRRNNVIEIVVPEYTVFQVNFKWANGSGDRHTAMIVADLNNKALKKTNTVYWGASGTVPLYLNAGTYRLYPYTQSQMVDRGDLQVLMMARTSFEIRIGGAIA